MQNRTKEKNLIAQKQLCGRDMTGISTTAAATKTRGQIVLSVRNYFSEAICVTLNAHWHQTAESAFDI